MATSTAQTTNVTRLPAAKKAKKTARKTTRRVSKTAKKAVRTAASAATKTINTATRAATAKTPADAMGAWTDMFSQSPFTNMESFMKPQNFQQDFAKNFANFPQFQNFQMPDFSQFQSNFNALPGFSQFQNFQQQAESASNQASTFATKATQAAEKSRNRLAAGIEECSKTVASMTQSNMQRSTEAMRTLMACKSLNELADVQNRLFKQNYEAMSAETSRLIDQITRTLSAASEPMNDLAASALSEAKKAVAA